MLHRLFKKLKKKNLFKQTFYFSIIKYNTFTMYVVAW